MKTGHKTLGLTGAMRDVMNPRLAGLAGVLVALAAGMLAWPGTAQAATGTWTGGGGATWDTTSTNWSGVSGTPWDSTNGITNTAYFNTGGATPSVSGTVYTNGITFDNTATISGGTVSFGGTTPTITANAAATISSTMTGSAGLTKPGPPR